METLTTRLVGIGICYQAVILLVLLTPRLEPWIGEIQIWSSVSVGGIVAWVVQPESRARVFVQGRFESRLSMVVIAAVAYFNFSLMSFLVKAIRSGE